MLFLNIFRSVLSRLLSFLNLDVFERFEIFRRFGRIFNGFDSTGVMKRW